MQCGFSLITELSGWLILLCLIMGAAISLLMYFRSEKEVFGKKIRVILFILRFLSISLIAFLLLNPMIKRFTRDQELPLVLIALDNSESMMIHSRDTMADAGLIRNRIESLIQKLSGTYKVETFSFGERVSDTLMSSFQDKETDISSLFSMFETRYSGMNTGAVIMISDGIWNKGFGPMSIIESVNYPVYTAAWGDTTLKRDLILAEVNYNRIAYLGNTFPVEIVVKGHRCKDLETKLVVRTKKKVLFSQPLMITSDPFSKIISLQLNAEKEGIMGFEVSLEPVSNEITTANNRTRAFVEILSGKRKVLMLYHKPHPDLAAIHNALLSNDMLEVEMSLASDFNQPVASYDIVILHQLPSDRKSSELFKNIVQQRIPILLVGGGSTNLEMVTAAGAAPTFSVERGKGQHDEVLANMNGGFALFTPGKDFTDQLPDLPPLYVPFGTWKSSPGEQILLFQKVGKVNTQNPLISFYQLAGNRACFIAGEGIWRWRMFSFKNAGSHKPFDSFFNQFIQYLTANEERTRFKASTTGYVNENEHIIFNAELYDASFQPVTDPEVVLNLQSGDGEKYAFTFSRKERSYVLDAGRLPVGEYAFTARTTLGAEKFSSSGKFVIAPLHIESTATRADHQLLRAMSDKTGAFTIAVNDMDKIADDILSRDEIKPVSHLREKFTDLTHVVWLMIFIFALLAAEWFIRKRVGSY